MLLLWFFVLVVIKVCEFYVIVVVEGDEFVWFGFDYGVVIVEIVCVSFFDSFF